MLIFKLVYLTGKNQMQLSSILISTFTEGIHDRC